MQPQHAPRVRGLYRKHIRRNRRRERLLMASISFCLTAILVRALTLAIHLDIGPFHNVSVGGTHVHHLVWGILILLGIGFVWLIEFGIRSPSSSILSRISALGFGVGAALTLDEFALWLELKDVYWASEGRRSVEALLAFGALLSAIFWSAPLIRGLVAGERVAIDEYHHLRKQSGQTEGGKEAVDRAP